jgi:ATP adenylyltransferase
LAWKKALIVPIGDAKLNMMSGDLQNFFRKQNRMKDTSQRKLPPHRAAMNILWAPWRRPYIEDATKPKGCILCQKPNEKEDRRNLLLFRGGHCFILLNLFPYNNGHLMIVPYRHLDSLSCLSPGEMVELLELAQKSEDILRKVLKAEGFNLGINLGKVAGAGIADHIHLHILPRWTGDTNFLPTIGKTKVISEDLDSTYERLFSHFHGLPEADLS